MINLKTFEEIISSILENHNDMEKKEIYYIFKKLDLNEKEINEMIDKLVKNNKIEKIHYLNDENNYFITKKEDIEPILSEEEINKLIKGEK
jgi:predicted transcriptional regulator